MRHGSPALLVLVASLLVTGVPGDARAHGGAFSATVDDSLSSKPTPLRDGIGAVHQTVSTKSEKAQKYYDQGLAHLHSYRWIEAARSFHEALRLDPQLAMAQLGLARAYEGLKDDAAADRALAAARALEEGASPRERAYLEAYAAKRAALSGEKAGRDAATERYRKLLDALIAEDESDAEAWLLRGNAAEGAWGRGQGGDESTLPFYEGALRAKPGHFAAHHYLAHTYENLDQPAKAVQHAKLFAEAAPNVPHARHMYAHTLPRVGRWAEAVAELEAANQLEEDFARSEGMEPSHDWHRVHNLTLLGLAYLRAGRPSDAEKALREAFETPIPDPLVQSWHSTWPEFLLVMDRPDEALKAAQQLATRSSPMSQVIGAALTGEAKLALGDPQAASAASGEARTAILRLQESAKGHSHEEALVWVATEYANVLDARRALHAQPDPQWISFVGQVGDQIGADPTFDGWGIGWLRLQRLERDARAAGQQELAKRLKVHLDRTAGSSDAK